MTLCFKMKSIIWIRRSIYTCDENCRGETRTSWQLFIFKI